MARAERQQAVFELQAAIGFLAPQPLDDLGLGRAFMRGGDGGEHGIGDQLGGGAQLLQFRRRLQRTHALEGRGSVEDPRLRQRFPQQDIGVGGQETGLDADPRSGTADLAEMLGGTGGGVRRAPAGGVHRRRPERMVLVLARFEAVADIGGVIGPALLVDHDGQIAAVADGVHGGEEDELVAAEHVLDIVLRGGDQHVEIGFFHQPVDTALIEGGSRRPGQLPALRPCVRLPVFSLVGPVCTESPAPVQS